MTTENSTRIKSQDEIALLRQAGSVLATIVKELKCSLKPGITTGALDSKAEELIESYKAQPAFKGYRGFPACICASINEEVVHGIPGKRVVNEGDILSVDVGIILGGYYADTAFTAPVGEIALELKELLSVTQETLRAGIEQARSGNHLTDISSAIQTYAEGRGYGIVRDFVGHGIGRSLHEDPEVPNFGPPGQGPLLQEGMVLAIEPMVNLGGWQTKVLPDGWTVVTEDGRPSAHFEHTVAITASGPEILTVERVNG